MHNLRLLGVNIKMLNISILFRILFSDWQVMKIAPEEFSLDTTIDTTFMMA